MSISLANDAQVEEVKSTLAEILQKRITQVERIGGGKNSQVYHITCEAGGKRIDYAVKRYFRHSADLRDRLGVEYGALTFLTKYGVDRVPKPIAVDIKNGLAVYEYIDGVKKDADQVTEQDIDDAVSFLIDLDINKGKSEAKGFIPASEANFSIQAVCDHVRARVDRLKGLRESGENYLLLDDFLSKEIDPAFHEIGDWCRERAGSAGILFEEDIPILKRTLSPSDFGFHNALWRGGKIIFLDFEYFGWDDPAKMIVDFLLHPALPMQISAAHKTRYVGGLIGHFKEIEDLSERTQIVYPLFALKWIMIILNEFMPADLMRRQFAGQNAQDKSALQRRQLEKARRLLCRIVKEYKDFPYIP